jgi:hypothetical protein
MEAAALYTFAKKRNAAVLCLAQVTNTMGLAGQDFEKGEAQGADHALQVLEVAREQFAVTSYDFRLWHKADISRLSPNVCFR